MAQNTETEAPLRLLNPSEDLSAMEQRDQTEKIRFPEPLIILAKRKSFILKFFGIAVVFALGLSLCLPNMYTANAKILPPQRSQSMSTTAILNQLGPLGALAGQGIGLHSPSDLYVAMLRSDSIANTLVGRFSLMKVYDKDLQVDAKRRLQDRSEISAGKDGVISISVEDRNPKLAAALANGYVEELEKLSRTLTVTEAGERRIFFEREVKMASDDLANAELALKQTQEKTGLILLDSQSRAMIESLSSLRARVAAEEVQVQSMRSFATPENPDLIRAEQELAALRGQLARLEGGNGKRSFSDVPIEKVPAVGLEYIRKLRDVKYRETLFELLAKQYETAKIDEARDAVVVQQLDIASPPQRKTSPHRAVIVLVVSVLALLGSILSAIFMEALERGKEGPQFAARLHLFRYYLRGGQKS